MPTVNEVLNQGWQFHQQGNHDVADRIYRDVLRQVPNSSAAWCYLGILLHDQRRFPESEEAYRRALGLQDPFPIAWNNLGNSLRMLGRLEEADQAFETALQQDPSYLSPLKNRGTLWVWTGELDRGLAAFREGLRVAPHEAELHRNIGVIYLLQGRFAEGWNEYRWRWKTPGFIRPNVTQPVWDGSDPAGKTLMLYPEQGLGDTIHFVRMARELKARGATTIVQVEPKLLPLLSSSSGIDHLIPEGVPPGHFDFHCSFIDVADRLGIDVDSIAHQEAYLTPPESLVAYWGQWLGQFTGKLKVGICWQGNPSHQADIFRSIPLEVFRPLAEIDTVQLFCLQFGHGIEQLDSVDFADKIVRLPSNIDQSSGAFLDTAAIIAGLDIVVTSDTSLAHLAGAVGAQTWVALPFVPDWRWLLSKETTPWYPTMRLYRQKEMKDWTTVFESIRSDLSDRADA